MGIFGMNFPDLNARARAHLPLFMGVSAADRFGGAAILRDPGFYPPYVGAVRVVNHQAPQPSA
jgi:hypothetical protein